MRSVAASLGSDVAAAMGATLLPEGGGDSESTFAFIFTELCCDKINFLKSEVYCFGEAELRHLGDEF